jgi:glutaredoxin-related protein
MNPAQITARHIDTTGLPETRRRRGSKRRRLVGPVIVASMLAATGLSLTGQIAHAAMCTDSWIGGIDSLWTTSANWTTGVPDATKDVCIGDMATGTYAVTLNAAGLAKSISVGGASGAQTLIVGNTFGSLTISGASTVGVNGVLNIDLSYNNANSIITGSTVTNNGTLRVTGILGAGAPYLRSNVINNGTLAFQAPGIVIDSGVTITNLATTTVSPTASVIVRDGATFVNQSGTLTNSGTFTVRTFNSAGAFTQVAGTVTGHDPVIEAAQWNGTGTGAGEFTVVGASTLTGGIAAAQTLRIDDTSGNGIVGIPTTFTNAGTLILDMNYNNGNTILQPSGASATLTNTGTLRVTGILGAGRPYLRTNLINNGTLAFQHPETVIDSGVTITNNATTTVAANDSVIVRDSATFANQAGTLANSGTFMVRTFNSAGTFTQGGGTVTGNDPVIEAAKWNGTGAGAGTFTVVGASTLTGGIAAAQTLRIDDTSGNGIVGIPTTFTNAGTLIVDMNYGNANTILQPSGASATLTNTGTLRATGILLSAGNRSIRVDVVNSGTFIVDANVVLDFTGAFNQLPSGTTEFGLASATVFGRMVGRNAASATLAGTAKPVLVSGYSPPANTTFDVITSPHSGGYATVTNGFGSDVTNAAFVRLVSGVAPVAPADPAVDALVPARVLDTRPDATTFDRPLERRSRCRSPAGRACRRGPRLPC